MSSGSNRLLLKTKARKDGQCHLCPVYESVQKGNFSDKPFERTPCFHCREVNYEQFPHRGQTFVAIENLPLSSADDADDADDVSESHMSAFVDFVREFMRLPSETRDIVGYRLLHLHGEKHTYRSIARRMKVTIQAVESRHRAAIERIPHLAAMFRDKQAKRERRASPD